MKLHRLTQRSCSFNLEWKFIDSVGNIGYFTFIRNSNIKKCSNLVMKFGGHFLKPEMPQKYKSKVKKSYYRTI